MILNLGVRVGIFLGSVNVKCEIWKFAYQQSMEFSDLPFAVVIGQV